MAEEQPLSRRDLLRGRLLGRAARQATQALSAVQAALTNAASALPAQTQAAQTLQSSTGRRFALPIHRPPGAVDEVSFLASCTRCNECISACPVSAIVHAPARFREAAGTPMIDPHAAACIMCEDTPCITACKPGVLKPEQPRKMGVAWIQTMACLAHSGSFCTVCSERCPVPDAIEVTAGKPRIREDVCTGCGVCANVCPSPTNAVVLMPLADRPRAGGESPPPQD
ncbi:MAG: 4Fe-4S dicluster domain-containing protein [Phycisphaerales bacterium]|nr:4Fe-4S dicluster domain-containing protein [Phycisphaerales bacterium]